MTQLSLQDAPTSPPGQDCDAAIIDNNNTRLEVTLNGSLDDVNLAVNSPVVVATTIAGLGTARGGKWGLLRAGASPYNFIPVVYSNSLGKWVTRAFSMAHQLEDLHASNSVLTLLSAARMRRPEIPFKDLYDAGLRPQVFIAGFKAGSDAAGGINEGENAQLRVELYEWDDADTALGNLLYHYNTAEYATDGKWIAEGWADMVLDNAPTKQFAQLQVLQKGWVLFFFVDPPDDLQDDTSNVSVWLRWVSA